MEGQLPTEDTKKLGFLDMFLILMILIKVNLLIFFNILL